MSYLDAGFNKFLTKELVDPFALREQTGDEASITTQFLPGSQIAGGLMGSSTGKLVIDWNNGTITISDGARNRVTLGFIKEDDGFGIKVVDPSGNDVLTTIGGVSINKLIAGTLAVVMDIGNPATGSVKIDGENNRIIVNDGSNNRIVIGEV